MPSVRVTRIRAASDHDAPAAGLERLDDDVAFPVAPGYICKQNAAAVRQQNGILSALAALAIHSD
jgi:hypothetical protein